MPYALNCTRNHYTMDYPQIQAILAQASKNRAICLWKAVFLSKYLPKICANSHGNLYFLAEKINYLGKKITFLGRKIENLAEKFGFFGEDSNGQHSIYRNSNWRFTRTARYSSIARQLWIGSSVETPQTASEIKNMHAACLPDWARLAVQARNSSRYCETSSPSSCCTQWLASSKKISLPSAQ